MSTRLNIANTIGFLFKCAATGLVGTLLYSMANDMVSDDKAKEEITKNIGVVADESTYVIVDSDTVRVTRNNMNHIFNFQYNHIMVRGKIEDICIDGEFTFDQFNDRTRIDEALKQGCSIARDFAAKTYDVSTTHEDVIKKQETAARFAANHCKLPAPGGTQ